MTNFSAEQYEYDLKDFLRGKKGGHLDRAIYRIPENWERIVREATIGNRDYYLADPNLELRLLEKMAQDNSQFNNESRPIRALFEIGAGTGEKIMPFVEGNEDLQSIALIDYEVGLNQEAHDRIVKAKPEIPILMLGQDFSASDSVSQFSGGRVLGLILGGTIANISALPLPQFFRRQAKQFQHKDFLVESLTKRFQNAANFYHNRGELIVTVDTGDETEALAAYQGQEHADFIFGALDLAVNLSEKGLLETDLTKSQIRSCFKHDPIIVKPTQDSWGIAHTLRCMQDIDFTINGEEFFIKAGFSNSVINSFKPTPEQVQKAAEAVGFQFADSYIDETGRVTVMHFTIEKVANDRGNEKATPPLVRTL